MNNKLNKSIFKNFDKLSENIIIEDFDAAKEFLADLKIDPNEISKQGTKAFKRTLFLAKARENQTNDQMLLEKLRIKIQESMERNATLAGQILKEALSDRRTSFQFRNLEKWSDDELREVLSDADLIKLMEDLDDIENK